MAQRVVTQLISDLSGDEIADGTGETVEFSFRGTSYSIDLTDKESSGFDKSIALYVENATKTGGRRKSSTAGAKSEYNAKEVRAWAKSQGLDVPDRGRIPLETLELYRSAKQ